MKINKKLTLCNFTEKDNTKRIKFIVVHYTANSGDTAKNNADYFHKQDRGASAHYFVDENEVWQVVEDGDISWHCGKDFSGGKAPFWGKCLNSNSIGIEMCNFLNINNKVKNNTIELIKSLMEKYGVPVDHVIRHYDVCGKNCPLPYVKNPQEWNSFKQSLLETISLDKKYSIEDCTQQCFWNGIIFDRILWNMKAYEDTDVAWLFLKFYDYILKNGGSVRKEILIKSAKEAIEILQIQKIISEPERWESKAAKDEDVYWLLLKMADFIS